MKRYLCICAATFLCGTAVYAQEPEDALRSSWFIPGGSARSTAIGGAIGALGGDISASNVNPAGIGMYKNTEFVISPGLMFNSNKINYRDSAGSSKRTAFAYGPIGFVFGSAKDPRYSKWSSTAFAVSVTQLASYNNHASYAGFNNISSYSEKYLEELTRDRADTISAYNNYLNGASLAFGSFLIDTALDGNKQLIGYQSLVPDSSGIYQQYDSKTTGGFHEVAFAFAGNTADRLYLGMSVNVPIESYHRDLYYRETDASGNPNNDFNYFEYREQFKSSGIGLNAKLGMIYRATSALRLGLAFHTPSIMSFKDELRASITTDSENYLTVPPHVNTESSDARNNGAPITRSYYQLTPYRAIVSGSYVFNAVADTKQQRGFVSADVEFVNYRGTRYYADNNEDESATDYYKALNSTTKDYLKGALNVRVGGELKFDPLLFRAGIAYYGSPYNDKTLKASRTMLSGGLGYRAHGMFIDLTYAYSFNKDVNFPYRLADKPNTYAVTKNNRGNLLLTVGFKI
ncbi:OmpP1/FadL family transporter [Deminuibacter soli]|uniref:Aromatic hydrocarbon degradation protein n=1 Tax=Deminuibacter soli TaxID=2291815 RepID=A0A3E1NMB4_9BACT|nr:hypothetical protein [Deminuibacter soli]RFM28958.1 hypothetical protein DXN05_09345 [Deminuibacter soli]